MLYRLAIHLTPHHITTLLVLPVAMIKSDQGHSVLPRCRDTCLSVWNRSVLVSSPVKKKVLSKNKIKHLSSVQAIPVNQFDYERVRIKICWFRISMKTGMLDSCKHIYLWHILLAYANYTPHLYVYCSLTEVQRLTYVMLVLHLHVLFPMPETPQRPTSLPLSEWLSIWSMTSLSIDRCVRKDELLRRYQLCKPVMNNDTLYRLYFCLLLIPGNTVLRFTIGNNCSLTSTYNVSQAKKINIFQHVCIFIRL